MNSLKAFAAKADEDGRLQEEQLLIVYKEKWFKLFVPRENGGLALSLPDGLRIEEKLAQIDGSLGWTVTLCSGACMFIGYLSPVVVASIFNNPAVCFAGSGAVTGVAIIDEDGYVINGYWKYATGAPYATIFTVNCQIEKNGLLLKNTDGSPVYQSFFFYKEEVTLHKDWNTMGLRATASYNFEVKNLQVPKERSFLINSNNTQLPSPIYKYPFQQFAETTIAVNILGIGQHFLTEMKIWLESTTKNPDIIIPTREIALQKQERAAHYINELRSEFYQLVEASWNILLQHSFINTTELENTSCISKRMAKEIIGIVADLYPYCGVKATQTGTVLNRIFRDLFTASQHFILHI